ncbi:MutS-related protein [Sphingobacterium bovistauri]|uniref:DNA mismatch repair proteins mutS family domain-containing protein n=1 Tax=Sphingobacterium bovistauri TaxID=2781959 RepID=A0ABS7ZAJ1_9SPHI|nr:hypothetical protein [Sphingobacterium bovistauri]MCA5005934.1 hypothetical protein [Sphingobacterium bovistauri]
MTKTDDLYVVDDFLNMFNTTLNHDAKSELKTILSIPLESIQSIVTRQNILKTIIASELTHAFTYYKTDYTEVFYFLNIFDSKNFKTVDYLTYIFQGKVNSSLIGNYIQLSYFFFEIDKILRSHLEIKKYPELYQTDLHFILNYISSFQLKKYKKQTDRGNLNYSAVQDLHRTVIEKRKNGDTAKFYALFNRLEALISIATTIRKNKFVFPEFVKEGFTIHQMYHPLLANPIKNDFQTYSTVNLLTGANMSGKSTFLKTVGLIVYFAHLGLAVPAVSANIPYYDSISIHINHSDDIKNGLSHFMQEIVNMKRVLEEVRSGKRCFAIFDELYKGTNHDDALAISALTVDGLRQFSNSNFIISTHIYELRNQIENTESLSAYHLDCKVEANYPQFTYQLKEGWTNLKIGELLFEKEGLKELLKRS